MVYCDHHLNLDLGHGSNRRNGSWNSAHAWEILEREALIGNMDQRETVTATRGYSPASRIDKASLLDDNDLNEFLKEIHWYPDITNGRSAADECSVARTKKRGHTGITLQANLLRLVSFRKGKLASNTQSLGQVARASWVEVAISLL